MTLVKRKTFRVRLHDKGTIQGVRPQDDVMAPKMFTIVVDRRQHNVNVMFVVISIFATEINNVQRIQSTTTQIHIFKLLT